jgi:hypothetical protein
MLELDDIQHFLLARPHAMAARYGFLTFREPAQGRAYLAGIIDRVGTGKAVADATDLDSRWLTVALTWNGLRALGVDEASLATFPEEFRQGMAARAEVLGDTGANHPDNWLGGLASTDLHALVVFFARDVVSASIVSGSTRGTPRSSAAWRRSRTWTWRQPRHTSTRTTTSATAIESHSL